MNIPKLIIGVMRNAFWAACVCFMLLGSFIYIYSESFAVGTFVVLFFGPIFAMDLICSKRALGIDFLQFGALGLLSCLALIAVLVYPGENNFRYLKAFAFNFLSFPIVINLLRNRPTAIKIGISLFLTIILVIAVLQISYLFLGVGIDPTMVGAADYVAADPFAFGGVRSIYTNPNDFSVVCTLMLVLALYGLRISDRTRGIVAALLSFMILMAASRTSLVAAALILASYYLSDTKRLRSFMLYGASAVGLVILLFSLTGKELSNSYWGAKAETIFTIVSSFNSDNTQITDGSLNLRLIEYLNVVDNFQLIGIGSFDAQNYKFIVEMDELFAKNPHSLIIELSLLFGYAGLFAFCIMFLWLFLSFRVGALGLFRSVLLLACIFMLTFVSSSEINSPTFWLLLYLIAVGCRSGAWKSNSFVRPVKPGLNHFVIHKSFEPAARARTDLPPKNSLPRVT